MKNLLFALLLLPILCLGQDGTIRFSQESNGSFEQRTLPLFSDSWNSAQGYTFPSGTMRSLQSRLEDTLSVKDFGATGDGVTDDTAAIQAAMDAAGVAGKRLTFPTGTGYYKISDELVVNYSGQIFVGEAWNQENNAHARIVQTATNKAAFRITIPEGQGSTHNIVFDSLRIVGPGDSTSSAAGIDFYLDGPGGSVFSDFNSIRNCRVEEFRVGIRMSKFSNSIIQGSSIYGNYNNIEIGGNCNAILILDTQINLPTNIGVKSLGSGGVTMLRCEWGNGPKMVDLGQDSAQGMILHMIDNTVETVDGSPPDGSPAVAFQCRSNNALRVNNFQIISGSSSTKPVFRYDQGATGYLNNASYSGFTVGTELCQQFLNNPVPVWKTDRSTTYEPVGVYSDTGFTTLSYTTRDARFYFVAPNGIPSPAENLRGRLFHVFNNSGDDLIYFNGRVASGSYENTPLTPTKTVNTWNYAQTFQGNMVLDMATGGAAVKITEGANRRAGVTTLTSGTSLVSTVRVTGSSRFHLTRQAKGSSTGIGSLNIATVTSGTSFVIESLKSDATVETGDLSTVFWWITEP